MPIERAVCGLARCRRSGTLVRAGTVALLAITFAGACGDDDASDAEGSSGSTSPPAPPDERLVDLDPCTLLTPEERIALINPPGPTNPPDGDPADPPVDSPREHDRGCVFEAPALATDAVIVSVYPNTPAAEVSSVPREELGTVDGDTVEIQEVDVAGRQAVRAAYDGGPSVNHAGQCTFRILASDTSTVEVYANNPAGTNLSALCEDVRWAAEMVVDTVPPLESDAPPTSS